MDRPSSSASIYNKAAPVSGQVIVERSNRPNRTLKMKNRNFRMKKWIFIALAMVASVQAERPPNIVFIVADDLGWADTTPYGSTFHETPNIQRLSDSGMRFLNAHTTSPVCSPGRR